MDPQLVERWYEEYKLGIYRFALSLLRDAQLAEDVLQETFAKALGNPFSIPTPGKEKAWLYRVARNLCMDILRKRSREAEAPPEIAAPAGQNWEFLEMLAPLTQSEQELVSLKILGGFTHKEIAKITGITVHAAKKRYERAIEKLRQEMEES